MKFYFFLIVMAIGFLSGCSNPSNNSSADWVSDFVVWNGCIYQLSEEFVEEVDGEIGRVTKHSDTEGTYTGNFSNVYEKGTKFYAIQGTDPDEAIAVEEEDRFRKLVRDGKYGEKGHPFH